MGVDKPDGKYISMFVSDPNELVNSAICDPLYHAEVPRRVSDRISCKETMFMMSTAIIKRPDEPDETGKLPSVSFVRYAWIT
jgi:hypothetical protein